MLYRVIEIYDENKYLSLDRGFLQIQQGNAVLGKIPIDEIGTLLLTAQGVTVTKNVLNALSENGCITILCGKNYAPENMVVPIGQHYHFAKIVKTQINTTQPLKKRIWQQIIINKIKNQSICLKMHNKIKESKQLEIYSTQVKSGDTENKEAQAAKIYFKSLFGTNFIRNKNSDGINSLLNYGYAIIRSAMARAVCSAGLIPSLGLHHDNYLNSFCLVDDFLEIYRPIVDTIVYELYKNNIQELTPKVKKNLIDSIWVKIETKKGTSPVFQSMQYMVSSYVKSLEEKKSEIEIPIWKGNVIEEN